MKVKNLIDRLKKLDPNLDVVMSSDAEGNNFNFLDVVYFMPNDCHYKITDNFEFFSKEEFDDLNEYNALPKAVILFPK